MFADLDINPQVIIIFGAMIFAGLKALIERANKSKNPEIEQYEEEEIDYDYAEYEAELERQREVIRQESTPPPLIPSIPVVQQATPPPLIPTPKPKPVAKKASLSSAEKEALKNFEALSKTPRQRAAKSGSTKARLKRHLSSPTAAREALLLAEILGPPKAMQEER